MNTPRPAYLHIPTKKHFVVIHTNNGINQLQAVDGESVWVRDVNLKDPAQWQQQP